MRIQNVDIIYRYALSRPSDGQWGRVLDNGSWTGMMGMVHRNEVDLALGPFAATWDRAQAVSLTTPIVMDPLSVVVGRQSPKTNTWGFVLVFSPATWLGILVAVFAFTVTVLAVSSSSGNKRPGRKILGLMGLNVAFEFLRTLLQQDSRIDVKYRPVKVLLGCWMIFVLGVSRMYSSVLVSVLTVRNTPVLFKNLQDITQNPSINIILEEGAAAASIFRNTKTGAIGAVGEFFKQGRVMEMPLTKFLDAMNTRVHGKKDSLLIAEQLLCSAMMSQSFKEEGYCKFYLLPEYFTQYRMGLIITKNSPLLDPITYRILLYHSMGLYESWINKENAQASQCYSAPGAVSTMEPFSVNSFAGVFGALAAGLLLASVALALEICFPGAWTVEPARWRGLNVHNYSQST
ncbi:Ionotropic receptor 140 [Hyalella azteca]|uniref:Ionotropic receptor 140 n=1 Tax=Hyalella azteca TaxID=294128 RepID=A0A6A0H1D7_HYAAZ|nr:Ionotropic receptor 140 [Hyalella azteca]